jgi:hypothetical protein
MDLSSLAWHSHAMPGRRLVYLLFVCLLLVLNVISLGSIIFIPLLAESGVLDASPVLKLMMMWPFGPPLLLMVLFGIVGRSWRITKVAARAASALLLYVPLALTMMGYAFSGRFVFEGTDAKISVVSLILGALLAWFGFKSGKIGSQTPGPSYE